MISARWTYDGGHFSFFNRYEVGNQDHSCMLGVDAVRRDRDSHSISASLT